MRNQRNSSNTVLLAQVLLKVHARSKFMEVKKTSGEKGYGKTDSALSHLNKLNRIEGQLKEINFLNEKACETQAFYWMHFFGYFCLIPSICKVSSTYAEDDPSLI